MEEHFKKAMEWIKSQKDIKGCITGSSLLGYWPDSNQDIDVFMYNKESFTGLFYAMYHNPMFQLLDPLEIWKADKFRTNDTNFYKKGILTIKFYWNTCIPINIILKKENSNIFSVLSNFDMDIVARGIDIESGRMLDLSEPGNIDNKIATWNRWNPSYYDSEGWEVKKLLRQLDRVFKYHKRGYNTDEVVLKYMYLSDKLLILQDIFNSDNYTERLKIDKENTKIIKQTCEKWLKTHEISDKALEILKNKLKEL